MPSFDIFSLQADDEAQLQQELSELFATDTQVSLQRYLQIVQRLNLQSWKADAQELYRAIHTIKGGAVTVGAEALLPMAIALENILSDLRYLETPPTLADGHLSAILLEAGELLASTSQIKGEKKAVLLQIQPALTRIREIHTQIKATYCPQLSEDSRHWQDFANYGFDLIVLDLEMALERMALERAPVAPGLPTVSPTVPLIVPLAVRQIADEMLHQLSEIGRELSLASGWQSLVSCAYQLLEEPRLAEWQTYWPSLIRLLKQCAKQGGVLSLSLESIRSLGRTAAVEPMPDSLGRLRHRKQEGLFPDGYSVELPERIDVEAFLDNLGTLETFAQLPDVDTVNGSTSISNNTLGTEPLVLAEVQIPVALSRLDSLSQDIVDSLLTARSLKNNAQSLQPLIARLVALSQESRQYIEPLKQLRTAVETTGGTTGGTNINRLLETTSRFAEIGAEVETLSRQSNQSARALDTSLLNLQRTVEESRLVSFRTLTFRAKTILRDLTVRYGKSVRLAVQGETIDLDVGSARSLEPVLLHLIRNAYAHGIESVAERQVQEKPAEGEITLSLYRRGEAYWLEMRDDGQGICAEAVEARSLALGLPLHQARSPEQLLAVICQPGFSLEKRINEISGRGVGMDVVATQVAQMGGKLTLETELGKGTTFRLRFSAPRLLLSCILIRAGEQIFALPEEEIGAIALLETLNTVETAVEKAVETAAGEQQPIASVLSYWQPHLPISTAATDVCLCIAAPPGSAGSTGSTKLWLRADEIVESSELLVRSLPSPLTAPKGLIGVSIQPDGQLIPVLEGPMVAQKLLHQLARSAAAGAEEATEKDNGESSSESLTPERLSMLTPERLPMAEAADCVLIVDDAALMRRHIEISLQGQNYRLHSCVDGAQAWRWLQQNSPRLLITDIDMPNMDGFGLITRCRAAGMSMPILVVSSRLAEEWSDEAKRLGASDYLNKGFANYELLSRVEALLEPSAV
jgi:chemotaxis protein histidine kinase CheA/CheY-like chemotaxis protein